MRSEKIHSRMEVMLSFWDKIKFLLGWRIDVSYCIKVLICEREGKFEYMKVDSVDPKVQLYRDNEDVVEKTTRLKHADLHK